MTSGGISAAAVASPRGIVTRLWRRRGLSPGDVGFASGVGAGRRAKLEGLLEHRGLLTVHVVWREAPVLNRDSRGQGVLRLTWAISRGVKARQPECARCELRMLRAEFPGPDRKS